MIVELFVYGVIGLLVLGVLAVAGLFILKRRPRKLKSDQFATKWKELQKGLRNKHNWAMAIIDADNMLAEALKQRGYHSKSIGERLMRAQRELTDNDAAWFGHKLRGKIDADAKLQLTEKEVKQALVGIRQALKDLGALKK